MDKGKYKLRSKRVRFIIGIFSVFLPQIIKRKLLVHILHYEIHPNSYIGFSLIYPKHLIMKNNSKIGNLNICKGLSLLELKEFATIGNLNWITGVPSESKAFCEEKNRKPQLVLNRHSAITNRHLIDCCNSVSIGNFSTVAGFRSQILTHSIDLVESKQKSSPVTIGSYCFIGTGVTLLAGSTLPDNCILGASACLAESFTESFFLYGGVPAKPIKKLKCNLKYFYRKEGFVL